MRIYDRRKFRSQTSDNMDRWKAEQPQKWSDAGVLCAFWLGNVLRATTACTFPTSQLPKMVRGWGVFYILLRATMACTFSSLIWPAGSAPAALASLLFDPPEPQTIGKTQCFATFLPFRASASSFFWLFLFSDLLSSNFSGRRSTKDMFIRDVLISWEGLHFGASDLRDDFAWQVQHFVWPGINFSWQAQYFR